MGWIIRDSNGSLVGAKCKRIERRWSIKFLEAEVIHEGLKSYVGSTNVKDILTSNLCFVVESDSNDVINVLNRVFEDQSEISLLVEGIGELASHANVVSFSKCTRANNTGAHNLARTTIDNGDFNFFECPFVPLLGCFVFFCRDDIIPSWFFSVLKEELGVPNLFSFECKIPP